MQRNRTSETHRIRRSASVGAVLLASSVLAVAAGAPAAQARNGADDAAGHDAGDDNGGASTGGGSSAAPVASSGQVIRSGRCSGSARWKLKLKQDDGAIEVEFEVDSNKAGQRWSVALKRAGVSLVTGSRVTRSPSGSFTVERRVSDLSGADTVTGRAKHAGQVCSGSATLA